jgi:glycogen operon protein
MDDVDAEGRPLRDDVLLILFNAHYESVPFTLPGAADGPLWNAILDTARADVGLPEPLSTGASYHLDGRSLVVLCQDGDEWAARYGRYEAKATSPALTAFVGGSAPEEHTVVGTVVTLAGFASPELDNRRDIFVYLPPSYDQGAARYPVIYMQDGQNLFDAAASFTGVEWRVDETMQALAEGGVEAIVVGITNLGERRVDEYSPFVDPRHGGGRGDAYLAFIAETLKPHIDRAFRTRPEPEHTLIAGSSLGGLISLYALVARPETFGAAAALSPALWFADGAIFERVKKAARLTGRLYLDIGTAEGKKAVANVRRMATLAKKKGLAADTGLRYYEDAGGEHSEAAWGERFAGAVGWLLAVP